MHRYLFSSFVLILFLFLASFFLLYSLEQKWSDRGGGGGGGGEAGEVEYVVEQIADWRWL